MNSAGRKLWPDCVTKRDFEGFQQAAESTGTSAGVAENIGDDKILEDIVSVGFGWVWSWTMMMWKSF